MKLFNVVHLAGRSLEEIQPRIQVFLSEEEAIEELLYYLAQQKKMCRNIVGVLTHNSLELYLPNLEGDLCLVEKVTIVPVE